MMMQPSFREVNGNAWRSRALVHNPDVLLLDEPTGNLDSHNTEQIISLLHRLNRHGVTIAVVTHDPVLASASTRQLVLRDGSLGETTRQPLAARSSDRIETKPFAVAILSRRRPLLRAADASSDAIYGITDKPLRTLLLLLVVMLGAGG